MEAQNFVAQAPKRLSIYYNRIFLFAQLKIIVTRK